MAQLDIIKVCFAVFVSWLFIFAEEVLLVLVDAFFFAESEKCCLMIIISWWCSNIYDLHFSNQGCCCHICGSFGGLVTLSVSQNELAVRWFKATFRTMHLQWKQKIPSSHFRVHWIYPNGFMVRGQLKVCLDEFMLRWI